MMNIAKIGKRIDDVERLLMRRQVTPILVLRAVDYPNGVIPLDLTKKAQHAIVIKARALREGEPDEYSVDRQTH